MPYPIRSPRDRTTVRATHPGLLSHRPTRAGRPVPCSRLHPLPSKGRMPYPIRSPRDRTRTGDPSWSTFTSTYQGGSPRRLPNQIASRLCPVWATHPGPHSRQPTRSGRPSPLPQTSSALLERAYAIRPYPIRSPRARNRKGDCMGDPSWSTFTSTYQGGSPCRFNK